MTRAQAIAIITEHLATAPDAVAQSVADMLQSSEQNESALPRPLSPRERALIEQSKADFRNGDRLTPDELRAFLDAAAEDRARIRAK